MVFIVKGTTAMRVFALFVVHNHTWQLIITYTKIEIIFSNVIKAAVEGNSESDRD